MPDRERLLRIIVHAGFHKTGTTTVQQLLRHNATVLRPRVMLGLKPKLRPILSAARGYSTWGDPLTLMKFGHRVGVYLRQVPLGPYRALCLSCEELCGHMPGRDAVPDYSHAADLMHEFAEVAMAVHGPALELTFYFSCRNPANWLRSAWAEHVKATRLTLDFAAFASRYAAAADLDAVVAQIRARLAPHRVLSARLEQCAAQPLGPAQPLIDLLPLPPVKRAALQAVAPANPSPAPEVLAALLVLNRSDRSAGAVALAKQAILAG
ncbi:MAG: hypothetical protein Q8P60_10145 [Pseudorhodobacter sp.]|nr:hypothetical protein [Pseudorhodobacter sp.]